MIPGRRFRGRNAPTLAITVVRCKDLYFGENKDVLSRFEEVSSKTSSIFAVLTLEDQHWTSSSQSPLIPKKLSAAEMNGSQLIESGAIVDISSGVVEWDESLKFDVEDNRSWLDIELFAGIDGPSRQTLGAGEFPLDSIFNDDTVEEWIRLEGPEQCKTSILLRLSLFNAATLFPNKEAKSSGLKAKVIRKRGQKESEIDYISTMPSFHPTHIKYDVSNTLITESDMKREFDKYDKLQNGYISKVQFKKFYRNSSDHFGLSRTDAELDAAMQPFQTLPDNKISFDEFCLLVLQLLSKE